MTYSIWEQGHITICFTDSCPTTIGTLIQCSFCNAMTDRQIPASPWRWTPSSSSAGHCPFTTASRTPCASSDRTRRDTMWIGQSSDKWWSTGSFSFSYLSSQKQWQTHKAPTREMKLCILPLIRTYNLYRDNYLYSYILMTLFMRWQHRNNL